MKDTPDRTTKYQADSLSLIGAIALGTGVMIGAGIFQWAHEDGGRSSLGFPRNVRDARVVPGHW